MAEGAAGGVVPEGHAAPEHGPPEHGPLGEKIAGMDRRLVDVAETIRRLERGTPQPPVPAWRRVTPGEHRWPAAVAIAVMITLQFQVPTRFSLLGWWVLPLVEAGLLVTIVIVNPMRISTFSRLLRRLGLSLIAVATIANGWAAGYLVVGLVRGTEGRSAEGLLLVGGNIWITNILVFALWYWELDRGGPGARAQAMQPLPDFVFPQMSSPQLAPTDWEPVFWDYLYLAVTNATAFSPTDTLPFTHRSKLTMGVQSLVSLTTGALIIARAVNILK